MTRAALIRLLLFGAALIFVTVAGGVAYWLTRPDPGDERLRAFVHARPPVPPRRVHPPSWSFFFAASPDG